jgi:hypothetical protein
MGDSPGQMKILKTFCKLFLEELMRRELWAYTAIGILSFYLTIYALGLIFK